ncbi:HEAT repeat domain-containing protein [Bradyrhizobium sp.]|jgi:HEAT repeat protein|uniref:HEAT repeat domain-containing protein n=1 Tax=Bradyrhizobium sp. TaxID=376 RepID=UPI003C283965
MPLIRPAAATLDAIPEGLESRREKLAGGDVDERRHAARALSKDPAGASILAARLQSEPDPRVRDALFGSLSDIGGTHAAELVAPFIRSDDAGLRGGAIEALKRLEGDAVAVLDALMNDPDTDVRILAVEVTRAWPGELAIPRLRRVFELDPHVNVCAAAVDVATEVGTEDLLPALNGLRDRFANEQFLLFAVDIACARILGDDARAT